MRLLPEINLKPTFPVDPVAHGSRSFWHKLRHPQIGGPLVVSAIAILFATQAPFLGLVVAGGCAAVAWGNWKGRVGKKLEDEALDALVSESNDHQDEQLYNAALRYQRLGFTGYAKALGQFIVLKNRIEKRVGTRKFSTGERAAVEKRVDAICGSICDQFNQVIKIQHHLGDAVLSSDEKRLDQLVEQMKGILSPVRKAYQTLHEINAKVHGTDHQRRSQGRAQPPPLPSKQKKKNPVPAPPKKRKVEPPPVPALEDQLLAEADSRMSEGKGLPELLQELLKEEENLKESQKAIRNEIELLDDTFSSVLDSVDLDGSDEFESEKEVS